MVERLAVNYCSFLGKLRNELSGITVKPVLGNTVGTPIEIEDAVETRYQNT